VDLVDKYTNNVDKYTIWVIIHIGCPDAEDSPATVVRFLANLIAPGTRGACQAPGVLRSGVQRDLKALTGRVAQSYQKGRMVFSKQ